MNQKSLIASAIGAAFAFGVAGTSVAADAPAEKCFGIVKAGKNDCQTATNACAGHVKEDGAADAWIYVPAGTCSKIVGGSLAKK
jgi:uncharacterized membrane protein